MKTPDTDAEPDRVRTPESVEQLARLWRRIGRDEELEPVAVGGRQHLRANRTEAPWCAVETTACDAVVSVDRTSGLARVEAGVRWAELREEFESEELGVELLALQPSSATIGGLLGRDRRFEPQFGRGDIREACVGLATVARRDRLESEVNSANAGRGEPLDDDEYTYRTAPRKASGPDLRYLAISGESRQELILEATLVAAAPPALQLLRMPASTVEEATAAWRKLQKIGVRLGWVWWQRSEQAMWATMYGPERFLAAARRRLDEAALAVEIEGRSAARGRRRALESEHPDRRSSDREASVWAVTMPMTSLANWSELSPGVGVAEDLVMTRWGRHRATCWMIGLEGEPPGWVMTAAMAARRVTDGYRRCELPMVGGDDVE